MSQTITLKKRRALQSPSEQGELFTYLRLENTEFHHYPVEVESFSKSTYLEKILSSVVEADPHTYEEFAALKGVGAKTVRALALVSEVIYGAEPSYLDPARYSFAFGGKDGTPYGVDRPTYDAVIAQMKRLVEKARFSSFDKQKMYARLEGSGGLVY